MQIRDLVNLYASKTDEEIVQLAEDPAQLTPEAQTVLFGELTRRRIEGIKQVKTEDDAPQSSQQQMRRLLSPIQPHEPMKFIAEVLRLYHSRLSLFVKLMGPAVVIGWLAIFLGRRELSEVIKHLSADFYQNPYQHPSTIFGMWLVSVSGYIVSWIAFCASFGAICSAVWHIEIGSMASIGQSFAAVGRRWWSFLRLTLVLLLICAFAIGLCSLLASGTLFLSTKRHLHLGRFTYWIGVVFWALCLLVLSRFALAMPAVLLDRYQVGKALFRSDELTEGKWLTLAALLFKSLIGGYVAGLAPFWLASWIPRTVSLPSWFSWVLTLASIVGVTVVEPPMFIGFALLYLRAADESAMSDPVLTGSTA
jgi:hypothetical protein